jgi:hypothetical protein
VLPKRFLSLCDVWRKPCTYLAPTLILSLNGPNKIPHDLGHLVVTSGVSKMIFEPVLCLACIYLSSRLTLSLNGLNRAFT